MKRSIRLGSLVLVLPLLALGLAGTANAAIITWTGGAGATWDTTATNWDSGTNPWDSTNGPTNTASFGTVADQANLSGTVYAGGLTFNQSATVSNGGNTANSLKYATDGSTMAFNVASGKTGTINADINYGGAGSSGNILTLTGGGKLVLAGNTLLVANDGGAKSAYFSVEGGSELDVTGTLATMILNSSNRGSSGNTYMGGSSGNNILKVTGSSGRLVTGNFNIGSAGNDGNQVYISAPGTYSATTSLPTTVSWTLYGNSAQLNMKSSNNLVQIDSGAFVLQTSGGGSAGWIIGSAAGNNGNKLIVTGLGTTLSRSSSGYVQVGAVGSNNGYEIKAGGLVVGGRIEAGQGNGTDATNNNYYLVTGTSDGTPSGTPSYFRVNGAANGHFALGEKANTDGNSFRVEAGARADLFGTGTGKNFGIGFVSGANNNYIKVTGVGSTFNLIMGQELTVGGNQSGIGGSGNHVDVFDGGSLIMNNTDNTIPLAAPVSWTTWAAPPTTSTAMNLTGATSSLNIGNGTGNTALVKIGSVNGRTGVQLTNASSTLNFSNGRLRMVGVSGTLVSGIGTVNLNGPAYFDTNNTNSIDSVIDGTVVGTLIKEGGGTLTLSQVNTYLGDTRVDAGTLSISNAYLADAAAVRMLTGGVLNLTTGTTDTIGALYFDNVLQATGTWGALSSGAQHESAFITGTGRLDVVPEPATMAFVLLGGVGLLARRRRRA